MHYMFRLEIGKDWLMALKEISETGGYTLSAEKFEISPDALKLRFFKALGKYYDCSMDIGLEIPKEFRVRPTHTYLRKHLQCYKDVYRTIIESVDPDEET